MNDVLMIHEFQDVFIDDTTRVQVLKKYSDRNCLIRDWMLEVFKIILETVDKNKVIKSKVKIV